MKGTTCRAAKPAVFTASLLLLLGGCTQDAKLAPGESPVVAVVAKELGGHRFLKVHSERNTQGYTIESGNLSEPLKGKIDGSLVMVTDTDGAITAIVDRPGRRGTLYVDKAGARRFLEEPPYDYLKPDSVEGTAETASASAGNKPDSTGEIDALVLFSTKALAALNADPVAFALAQLETSNLGLRNSQVAGVHLRLAGVRVTETDLPVDGNGLRVVQDMLTPLRPVYMHDINLGNFENSPYAGMAYRPGGSNVNSIHYPLVFRHEIGHNVGGGHCHPDAGDNYKHGFKAGEGLTTNLCGNQLPYYSNPDVRVDGKPIGNAQTANMARLWREQAGRLSGYSPAFEGQRMIFTSYARRSRITIRFNSQQSRGGVVALSSEVGPTSLIQGGEGMTRLRVKLQGGDGNLHPVNFRAFRLIDGCPELTVMNSYVVCQPNKTGHMLLTLDYYTEDNPELAPGWYNGTMQLKAVAVDEPGWSQPILVSLAVKP